MNESTPDSTPQVLHMATLQESIQQNHNPNDSRLDDLTHQETVIRIHDDFPNISNVLDFIFWQDHIKNAKR